MLRKLIFGLCASCILNMSAQAQEVDSSRIVRVLTYNILHGKTLKGDFDLDLIAKVIADAKPDLVALQEVDYQTNRARKYDLVTELGWRTKMSPLFARAMPYDGGEYGEGILSKYTFLTTKNHPLPYTEGKEPRAAAEIQVKIESGDVVRLVGTHLDHEKDPHNRFIQAQELNRVLTQDDLPSILVGDLNETPEQKVEEEKEAEASQNPLSTDDVSLNFS